MEVLTIKQKETIIWITDFIKQCLENSPKFTGKLEMNFFGGNLANINKTQSYKMPDSSFKK